VPVRQILTVLGVTNGVTHMQFEKSFATKNQHLLTISIPTYNRAKYLDLCLKRISEEIESLGSLERCLVGVYVSDNASSDETSKVIGQYQERLADALVAVRNGENTGPDYNITQCYESANTPYVWIIGDDDVLLPGGLKMVLDTLKGEEIDLLYAGNYWFKGNYLDKPARREKSGTIKLNNPLDFVRRTNVMLTFISGLIVRSGVGVKYRSELRESNLVQLSWVLPLLRDGKHFAIIEDWVVAAKEANSGGYGLITVFGENLQRIANMILSDRPALTKAIENGTIVYFFPGFVMDLRCGSSKFQDKSIANGLKSVFGNNWRYFIFLLPLIAMPLYFSRYYYYLTRLIRLLIGPYLI